MAGLTASVPGIMWLSAYKGPLFLASGLLLAGSAFMQWQARNSPCPVDPILAASCMLLRRNSRWILAGSVVVYVVGVFFAYLWPLIFL
jgi:hypothetical protein